MQHGAGVYTLSGKGSFKHAYEHAYGSGGTPGQHSLHPTIALPCLTWNCLDFINSSRAQISGMHKQRRMPAALASKKARTCISHASSDDKCAVVLIDGVMSADY